MADDWPWEAADRLRLVLEREVDEGTPTVTVAVADLQKVLDTVVLMVPPMYEGDELTVMAWLGFILERHTDETNRPRILAWLNDRWGGSP